jgi:glycine cleavage system T protein (aminomethyltransferase)
MLARDDLSPLKRTPLHALHVSLAGKMVPFAGYEMPVQYAPGVLREHLHTRAAAGLFDVSHMGQLALHPRRSLEDAALALEALMPIDALGLVPGRQRYGLFTNTAGGILDDCMMTNLGDHFLIVVNAARKDADEAHLRAALSGRCVIERREDRALVALQGPAAEAVLAGLAPALRSMRFMDVRREKILGADCVVSRSGYTGEDGFEISIPAAQAEAFARKLLGDSRVAPVGLGARDSLRLEAGLCLYGSDLDAGTTPVEASLEWAIQKIRRAGGTRAGGFPGSDVILHELATGSARRRVGLCSQERTPVRGGSTLYPDAQGETPLGRVTSGGFGPSVNAPVAMGYVARAAASPGTVLFADVRGKRVPVEVSALPFVKLNYKRDL